MQRRIFLVRIAIAVLVLGAIAGVSIVQDRRANQARANSAREAACSAVSAAAGGDVRALADSYGRALTSSEVASLTALIPLAARSDLGGFDAPFWNPLGDSRCVVQVQHDGDQSFAVDVTLESLDGQGGWVVVDLRRAVAK
ncbi:MAG: hypothetical protein FDZ70_10965 [Actinobacteria bacterium]|nr:MAG: hypothetical protein FDZ70_10965 [Actinomycetota bacterium]